VVISLLLIIVLVITIMVCDCNTQVMVLLDDVSLKDPFDIDRGIELMQTHELSVMSPGSEYLIYYFRRFIIIILCVR
jgi:hypothetical protein